MKESELYPRVEKWMKRHFRCFATATNTGLAYSRPDVTGVRDIGGDLSGEIESIIIEVKRGASQPFATASGQALGYRVYANLVYLAEAREKSFTPEELQIASHLGIGLIWIKGRGCSEVLSSPSYTPITRLNRLLLEKLALGHCQLCGSVFQIGERPKRFSKLTREKIDKAIEQERGVMFWNLEVAERKRRLGIRDSKDGWSYERRFLCPGCVGGILSQLRGGE